MLPRGIPGVERAEDSGYLYVEAPSLADFRKFWKFKGAPVQPVPSGGGMINENIIIKTPDGRTFFGLSFGGDLVGWRRLIEDRARRMGFRTAEITDKDEIAYEGGSASLAGCVISFY